MQPARLLDLPSGILDCILASLPRNTKRKLRLTCKQLYAAVSAGISSLSLPSGGYRIGHGIAEHFCYLHHLTVPCNVNRADLMCLLQCHPKLFHNLSELHMDMGIGLEQGLLIPQLVNALQPEQRLSIQIPGHGFNALGRLLDHQCLTRITKLSLEALSGIAGLPGSRGLERVHQISPLLATCFSQLLHVTELHYTCSDPAQIQVIGQLSALEKLELVYRYASNHAMSQVLVATCNSLMHLTSLSITGFQQQRSAAESLTALTRLRHLQVSCHREWWQQVHLNLINIFGHELNTADDAGMVLVQSVGHLTALQSLVLTCSLQDIGKSVATALSDLTQLTHLGISRVSADASVLLHRALARLRSIDFSGHGECWSKDPLRVPPPLLHLTSFTGRCHTRAIPLLANWTALQRLHLLKHKGAVGREGLRALATLPALQDLKLHRVNLNSEEDAEPTKATTSVAPLLTFPALLTIECLPQALQEPDVLELCAVLHRATRLLLLFEGCFASNTAITRAFQQLSRAEAVQLDFKASSDPPLDPLRSGQMGAALIGLLSAGCTPLLSSIKFMSSLAVNEEDVFLLAAFPQLEEVVLGCGNFWPPALLAVAEALQPRVELIVERESSSTTRRGDEVAVL